MKHNNDSQPGTEFVKGLHNTSVAHFVLFKIESLVLRNKKLPMVFLSYCGQLPV